MMIIKPPSMLHMYINCENNITKIYQWMKIKPPLSMTILPTMSLNCFDFDSSCILAITTLARTITFVITLSLKVRQQSSDYLPILIKFPCII